MQSGCSSSICKIRNNSGVVLLLLTFFGIWAAISLSPLPTRASQGIQLLIRASKVKHVHSFHFFKIPFISIYQTCQVSSASTRSIYLIPSKIRGLISCRRYLELDGNIRIHSSASEMSQTDYDLFCSISAFTPIARRSAHRSGHPDSLRSPQYVL